MVLVMPYDSILKQALNLEYKASNNEAKYEGLLVGLRVIIELQVKELSTHGYFMILVNAPSRT